MSYLSRLDESGRQRMDVECSGVDDSSLEDCFYKASQYLSSISVNDVFADIQENTLISRINFKKDA